MEIKFFLLNGALHNPEEPAITLPDGTQAWFKNGRRHREVGPAIISPQAKEWWFNGRRHRLDGPAIEYSGGDTVWYNDGKIDRRDGPAVQYAQGSYYFFIKNKKYSFEDWLDKLEITDAEKAVFLYLKWKPVAEPWSRLL